MKANFKVIGFSIVFLLLLAALASPALPVAAQGQAGTTLTEASVTITPHWTRTYQWTINKSVSPQAWNLFRGDNGTSLYTISVAKDNGSEEAWVDGQVCFTNSGAVATQNLAIEADLYLKVGSAWNPVGSVTVDVSSNPVLDPAETGCYPYKIVILNPQAGGTYKVTANITITNHSGHLGELWGPSPSAATAFLSAPTLVHDSITVIDTNGASFKFSDDGEISYSRTFTCDSDQGKKDNTATITYDDDGSSGPSDSASVTVNCYALETSKDAATSFKRTYAWGVEKSADQSSLTLALNQSFLVNYMVTAKVTGYTDSDWAVSGKIWVKNPAPMAAELLGVSDIISGVATTPVECGVAFPYTLAAGSTLECTYSQVLPNASERTNTATASLQNYNYDKDLTATPNGKTDFTGTAAVTFGSASISEVDKCATFSDTLGGALGSVCLGEAPKTFTYSYTVGPYNTCGDYKVDNVASFVTSDTGTTGNAAWSVAVNVPCAGGCTLTIGYWKTHAGFGPQPDMVTPLLPQWLGTPGGAKSVQVTSAALAVQFLKFYGSNNVFEASNGINKLYAQLLAARLNIANGASDSSVAATISAADAFLASNDSTSWSKISKANKNLVLSWMTALDNYNNGLIGPGHCTVESSSIPSALTWAEAPFLYLPMLAR